MLCPGNRGFRPRWASRLNLFLDSWPEVVRDDRNSHPIAKPVMQNLKTLLGLMSIGAIFAGTLMAGPNNLNEKRPQRPPEDALLNLDLAGSEPSFGPAATGNSATDYWNYYYAPFQNSVQIPDLQWSTGVLSPVSVVVENGGGTWGNGHPNYMMNGYVYSGGSDIVATFSNLPNGTYDIYVYAHGGPPDEHNATIRVEAGGVTYGPETTTPGTGWLSTAWTEGEQYVLLEEVSVAAGVPLVIRSSPGVSGYSFLNGIQIRRTSKHAKRVKPERVPKPPRNALLNIDFAGSDTPSGPAATGDGATDYWNFSYAPYQYLTELFDLKWSTGELSPVTATVENGPGTWANGHANYMMAGYLYSYGSDAITVTLSDLPNGTYDVYVYAHGGPPDEQNANVSVESGGIVSGPESTATDSSWLSTVWVEGAQYVLFEGVSVTGGNDLVIRSAAGLSGYSFLNGIQIRQTSRHAKKPVATKKLKEPKNPLLNIDFAGLDTPPGLAATGNGPSDYWNFSYAPYQYFTELFDLKWSTGDLSTVSATVENGPGTWANGHPNYMMNGYLYSYGPVDIMVTLTGLPAGVYEVYVYSHGGPPDEQNGVVSVEAGGLVYGPEATATDGSWLSTTWLEGSQYVLLPQVSLAAGSPLTIRCSPGASGYSFLNGLQIRRTAKR